MKNDSMKNECLTCLLGGILQNTRATTPPYTIPINNSNGDFNDNHTMLPAIM